MSSLSWSKGWGSSIVGIAAVLGATVACGGSSTVDNDGQNTEQQESQNDEGDWEATLPSVAVDYDCGEPDEEDRLTTCEWVERSEFMVYGTIEEMTLYQEGEPDEPLDSCPAESVTIRITVDVDQQLYGEVEDVVEVHLESTTGWMPGVGCDSDDPQTVDWGGWDEDQFDQGIGPLEVGQPAGIPIAEERDGYYFATPLPADPLFVERDETISFQGDAAFGCTFFQDGEGPSEIEAMSVDDFGDEIADCGE